MHNLQHFRKCFCLLPLVIIVFSCQHLNPEEASEEYKKYKFDLTVIQKLPVYDSLASTVIANYVYFKQFIKEDDAYKSYQYIPGSKPSDDKTIPLEVARKIDGYFTTLGSDLIRSFTFYTDSSVKISIRNRASEINEIDIEENLSYFGKKTTIQHREYPLRDTILNDRWQYWVRFNKQAPFNF